MSFSTQVGVGQSDSRNHADQAKRGGAAIVCTGRSDFPNQVNKVLGFPGIFRGALDSGATSITEEMKFAAALALATSIEQPTCEKVLPDPFDRSIAPRIAQAIVQTFKELNNGGSHLGKSSERADGVSMLRTNRDTI